MQKEKELQSTETILESLNEQIQLTENNYSKQLAPIKRRLDDLFEEKQLWEYKNNN